MSALTWLGVALLGGLGAVARFLLDSLVSGASRQELPFGTFTVNITGAFGLGLLDGLALSGAALVLAGTATLGSYTTFSTWMLETHRLREDGRFVGALANVVVSLGAGIGAAALGRTVGHHL